MGPTCRSTTPCRTARRSGTCSPATNRGRDYRAGLARASGKPAVYFATSARRDQPPDGHRRCQAGLDFASLHHRPGASALIGTDAFQEIDTYGMSSPVTKYNCLVRSAGDLCTFIPEAFRIAASGRPGPVLLDVPKDVQNRVVEFQAWPEAGRPDPAPALALTELASAAALINTAARPILYIGGGVIHAGAAPLVAHLAERAAFLLP